jgi:hypothetical protein
MNANVNGKAYEKYKKYYFEKKKLGWKSVNVFGPEELVEAVKRFVKEYRQENEMCQRK